MCTRTRKNEVYSSCCRRRSDGRVSSDRQGSPDIDKNHLQQLAPGRRSFCASVYSVVLPPRRWARSVSEAAAASEYSCRGAAPCPALSECTPKTRPARGGASKLSAEEWRATNVPEGGLHGCSNLKAGVVAPAVLSVFLSELEGRPGRQGHASVTCSERCPLTPPVESCPETQRSRLRWVFGVSFLFFWGEEEVRSST